MPRVRDVDSREIEFFEKQWADFATDPYYNEAMLKNRGPNYRNRPIEPTDRMTFDVGGWDRAFLSRPRGGP